MTHIKLTVNGTVEIDDDFGEWESKQPDIIKDMLKPGGQQKPWLMAVGLVISLAVQQDKSFDIDVESRSNRWTLKVEET